MDSDKKIVKAENCVDCPHNKLIRFHDDFGSQRCAICHKLPEFGLLYRCAAEKDGNIPEPEFSDLEDEMRKFNIGSLPDSEFRHTSASRGTAQMSRDESSLCRPTINRSQKPTMHTCPFRICHGCRPAHMEKVWRRIDSMIRVAAARPTPPIDDSQCFVESAEDRLINEMLYPSQGRRFFGNLSDNDEASSATHGDPGEVSSTNKKAPKSERRTTIGDYDIDQTTFYDGPHRPQRPYRSLLYVTNPDLDTPDGSPHSSADPVDRVHNSVEMEINGVMYRIPTGASPDSSPVRAPPPSPTKIDDDDDQQDHGGSPAESVSSTSSQVKGKYYDEATIKAMQEIDRRREMALDLYEDRREKRAGRLLSEGRFLID